jgi:hypothetical protein
MSRVEKHYNKIDQVRQQLFVTLLLHMSVSMSLQAFFRPPVTKMAFEAGFYASLRVLEANYKKNYTEPPPGDFARVVKLELKNVIVLLQAWEVKVWPKQKRLCVLADRAACAASSQCLSAQKIVDAHLYRLTSCEYQAVSSTGTPALALSAATSPRALSDDLCSFESKMVRSMVGM